MGKLLLKCSRLFEQKDLTKALSQSILTPACNTEKEFKINTNYYYYHPLKYCHAGLIKPML